MTAQKPRTRPWGQDPNRTLSSPPILQYEASCVALLRMLKGLVWATSKPPTEAPVSPMTALGSGRASLIIHLRWINITKLWVSQGSWTNCLLSVALCQAADTSSFPSINLLYSARLMAQGKGSTASFPPSVYAGEAESCPEAAERDQKWLCAVLSLGIKLPSVFTQDFYSLGAF